MEKITWNKLVYQHGYFQQLVSEFIKNKPLNDVKLKVIMDWLEKMLALVRKELAK
jgi:hypothetical protein